MPRRYCGRHRPSCSDAYAVLNVILVVLDVLDRSCCWNLFLTGLVTSSSSSFAVALIVKTAWHELPGSRPCSSHVYLSGVLKRSTGGFDNFSVVG